MCARIYTKIRTSVLVMFLCNNYLEEQGTIGTMIMSTIKYFLNVLIIVDFTTNLAVGMIAEMSTRDSDYYPVLAVDGSYRKLISTCASTYRTNPTAGSWWKVDLEAVYDIKMVMLLSRKHCCGETETLTLCKIVFIVYTGEFCTVIQLLVLLSPVI